MVGGKLPDMLERTRHLITASKEARLDYRHSVEAARAMVRLAENDEPTRRLCSVLLEERMNLIAMVVVSLSEF
jgi:hypothetical protein